MMDLKPPRPYGISTSRGRYWFDCKTRRRPHDLAIVLAMIALKHRLGEQVGMHSKGMWEIEWSLGSNSSERRQLLLPVFEDDRLDWRRRVRRTQGLHLPVGEFT